MGTARAAAQRAAERARAVGMNVIYHRRCGLRRDRLIKWKIGALARFEAHSRALEIKLRI